jgi:hypothetical protein
MGRRFPEMFFFFVLGGEDPIDHVQRTVLRSGRDLHPLLERIMRIHVTEEARHLSFARQYLRTTVPTLSRRQRAMMAIQAPIILHLMAGVMMRPPKDLVRRYEIPKDVLREAYPRDGAAAQAVRERFLLPEDAERIVHEAETSTILPHAAGSVTGSMSTSYCEQLASATLPNATVTAARAYPAGEFTSGRTFQVPAFCRVMVTARPSPDSDIKVEVWMPKAWNGKLLGTDNGGFSGAINYAGLAAGLTKGYAAVSTDNGSSDLYVVGVNGRHKVRLTSTTTTGFPWELSWSAH